jgi:hypothetical protein
MPDNASEHAKATVTLVLFQPAPFAAGVADPLIVGGAVSSLTVTDPEPELPNRSVAVEVFVIPTVFAFTESLAGEGPELMPEPASVADQAIATFALFQPAALGAGTIAALTLGPVLSRVYEAVAEPEAPVHFPCPLTLALAVAVAVCAPSPLPAVNGKVQLDLAEAEL